MSSLDGALNVTAILRDNRVDEVRIASPRRNVAPVFIGRSPSEASALAKNLFALCPAAQSLAAEAAGEAAMGVSPGSEQGSLRCLRLLTERFGEMLRASLLDWPQDDPPDAASIAALREILPLLRALPDSVEPKAAFERVESVALSLGLRHYSQNPGFFARQWAEVAADGPNWRLPDRPPDFLLACDDDAVAKAMVVADFALAPALPGRCVETGCFARHGGAGLSHDLSGRLAARYEDMAATLDAMAALLAGGELPPGLLAARRIGAREGVAAVDSARGRLYHFVRLDSADRIADYRIVAPTEWNFHPDGPFARLLLGATIGTGAAARRRVERLAFVFDPCIGVGVDIRDAAHA
jgi:hypothetical protein